MGVTVQFPDGRRFESAAGAIGPADSAANYDVASTKQVIGSVTKLFTTVLAVQLVEAGELELERTIDEWFEFADAKDITVRMLLQHTSGLADCLALMRQEQAAQVWTPAQLVALAVDAERVSDKGGVAFYSNTNFAALAMIVEAVTGKSWQTNVAERIAQPLGLSDVFYAGDAEGAEHLVDGWVHTEDGWVRALQFTDPSVGWGYGALTATNRDLARFGRALFDGDLFASEETLSKALDFTAEMDPSVLAEGEPPPTVGLGVIRYHLDGFVLDGHLGHILGYHAAILRDPETGITLTGTTNTEGAIVAIPLVKIAQAMREM
jgi:CubicO group peptidase (beta-lactamase class C family)